MKLVALVLTLVLGAAALGGCVESEYMDIDVESCLAMDMTSDSSVRISTTISGVYALSQNLWRTREIPVCWEDASFDAGQEREREVTRSYVERTWGGQVFEVESIPAQYQFRFVGWTRCSEGYNTGIRIQVADENPRTYGLGTQLAGRSNGMVLNFTFKSWEKSCSLTQVGRERCIGLIAMHEFGHAIGLAHEQNRDDTPESCDEPQQGTDGDTPLGDWDLYSVMNYCAPEWNADGVLSDKDIYWTRVLYYPEWDRAGCLPAP